ncbi:F510_1955 family glycosylhydrolase [Paenibacillus sp. sgz302251]|uniref:F510_1955 family glycosylhydrolase n=1 Tax=Paenibacillus sp. sgz302251 TaxID=3414493 RepID=UPI003C7C0D0D
MKANMKINSKMKFGVVAIIAVLILLVIIMFINRTDKESVSLRHIHGLGYTSDGKQLIIPAHEGLVSYANDRWQPLEGDKHDYMGFNAVKNGFYSSGHPARSSELQDPLGIVRSTDLGKSVEILDFQGVEDFHWLAVGYETETIYLFNPQPNAKLDAVGLYRSQDEALTWERSGMNGISGDLIAMAAHPTDPATIAVSTSSGAFLSTDFGDQFHKLPVDQVVTALAFGIHGDLFIGGKGILLRHTGDKTSSLSVLPLASDDAIMYIAQNPKQENEFALATSSMNVFLSKDNGLSWSQIADKGKGLSSR